MPKSQHSAKYKTFCELLVAARKAKGLTQTEVASALGKPQSYVAKYEGSERRLDVIEFLEIADVLGLRIATFLREVQSPGR